jgi:hypothetical protein
MKIINISKSELYFFLNSIKLLNIKKMTVTVFDNHIKTQLNLIIKALVFFYKTFGDLII